MLRSLWLDGEVDLVLRNLPGRTWHTIAKKAGQLKLRRLRSIHSLRDRRDYLIVMLVKRRREKGWQQKKLADRIGVSKNLLNRWELGRGQPYHPNLLNWAEALGCRLTIVEPEV